MTLPLLWLGLLVALCCLPDGARLPVDLRTAVIGAIAGYLSLWSVYQLFKLLTGKEGMGYGDFKLLAALGAWLGWQMLLPIIIVRGRRGRAGRHRRRSCSASAARACRWPSVPISPPRAG